VIARDQFEISIVRLAANREVFRRVHPANGVDKDREELLMKCEKHRGPRGRTDVPSCNVAMLHEFQSGRGSPENPESSGRGNPGEPGEPESGGSSRR
jgi:hypothetical protein